MIDRLQIDPGVWIAPGAIVVGDVTIDAEASIWYGCVIRGDLEPIRIGRGSNIQDLTMVHVDFGLACTVGEHVTVGHRCIVHACEVGDEAMIGMAATLLSGCRIGRGAVIAAGAVVREGFVVPDGKLAAGVPATIRGDVTEVQASRFRRGTENYIRTARAFRDGKIGHGPYSGRDRTDPGASGR